MFNSEYNKHVWCGKDPESPESKFLVKSELAEGNCLVRY
jgi:hypothetical protein